MFCGIRKESTMLSAMDKIQKGISEIKLSENGLVDAAKAIMTTDSVSKMESTNVNGATFSGIAKGAGMLAPALATMLCVVMTDSIVPVDVPIFYVGVGWWPAHEVRLIERHWRA